MVVGALGLEGASDCAVTALSDDRVLSEAHEALEFLGQAAGQALVHMLVLGVVVVVVGVTVVAVVPGSPVVEPPGPPCEAW